jgi:hypothetical protein
MKYIILLSLLFLVSCSSKIGEFSLGVLNVLLEESYFTKEITVTFDYNEYVYSYIKKSITKKETPYEYSPFEKIITERCVKYTYPVKIGKMTTYHVNRRYNMTKLYYRLCATFSDVGKLIPATESPYDHIDNLNKAWFKSIYYYNEEQKKQAEETIEVGGKTRQRGIAGIVEVVTNKLIFDFDHKTDLELAKADTIALCERLLVHGIPEESLDIAFSGSKGYAVEVVFKEARLTPPEVKNLFTELTEGLETADSVVVNASRIFRLAGTKHATSGLYKFPITFEELKTVPIEEIKEAAADYDNVEMINVPKADYPKLFDTIKEIKPEPIRKVIVVAGNEHDLDFTKMPKGFTKWKYALLNGYFPSGTRSTSLLILGSTLRYLNFPLEIAHNMLKASIRMQAQRFDQEPFDVSEMYNTVISQVYGPQWKGGCYSEDKFPAELQTYLLECGIPRQRKSTNDGFSGIDGIYDRFKDFAENIEENTIRMGIKAIDNNTRITTGMLFGLLASAGGGKTSVALQILNTVSLNGENSLFYSMDMGSNLIYQKLSQKHSGMDGERLFDLFKDGKKEEINKIRYELKKNYENVNFTFKTALTVEDIRQGIIDQEDETGKKIKFVVVDYLETILGPYSDSTANSAHAANALKDIATDLDVCILLLLQTQKSSGSVDEPLRSMRRVKGSSVTEQACSVIISLWREGFDPQNFSGDKFMTFCCVKNRLGRLFEVDTAWEGLTGTVSELPFNEEEELAELREAKRKQKVIEGVL